MESCFAGTFLDDIPILYWIPFQERAASTNDEDAVRAFDGVGE
jgi:hypothetical protein